MKKAKSTEMTSIRKKLLAAVAMLLVACVMTVSSTYAWFTLSTAPEVKGITTTVGANGNLEIALGTYDTVYNNGVPVSGVGTSMDKADVTAQQANITWGNLVDLSEGYGLDLVNLFPTRLNVGADGKIVNTAPLKYANYGSDGRVLELKETLKGYFENAGFFFDEAAPSAGVSGIGSASDMSERELAIMNYKNAYVSSTSSAQTAAKSSITLYGSDLASLLIQHINAGDTDTTTYGSYKSALVGLISQLQKANAGTGDALKAAILAYLASTNAKVGETALTDEGWKDFNDIYASKSIEEIMGDTNLTQYLAPVLIDYYNDVYANVKAQLGTAATKAAALGDDSTWDTVSEVVNDLVDSSKVTVCNMSIAQIKGNPDPVVQAVANGGLTVQIGYNDAKVYSRLADMLGTIEGSIKFKEGTVVSASGMTVSLAGFPAKLQAYATGEPDIDNPGILPELKSTVTGYQAPSASANAVKGLTDTYGYVVDLLFRTNASDSKLMLEVAGKNRVYGDNAEATNPELMGGGSNMTFTTTQEFQKDRVLKLMEGIRVVFFDTISSEIISVAILDTADGGYSVEGDQIKAGLKLVEHTFVAADDGQGYVLSTGADKATNELAALTANTIKRVSALVYLDGDVVDNSYVSALAQIDGVLNLQFGSSATLVPMENNNLMQGNSPTNP